MSRALDDLEKPFREKVFELLARCVERDCPVKIIDTLRTEEEQARNLANGVSWTRNSKHLRQPATRKARAIDLAPIACLTLKAWAPNHAHWVVIGEEAQKLGLVWGGKWKVRDLGHVEAPDSLPGT